MNTRILYLIKRAEIEVTSRMAKALEDEAITPIQFTVLYFVDYDSLTAKGKKLLSDCNATLDLVEEILLKGLSATETQTLRNLIGKILEASRENILSEN